MKKPLTRPEKLVIVAMHYLEELKRAGYLEGGKVKMTPLGEQQYRDLMHEGFNPSQDEINQTAGAIMSETGGIELD